MKCQRVRFGSGSAIVCGGRQPRRCKCGKPGTRLCDWKLGGGRTCDAAICDDCTYQPTVDRGGAEVLQTDKDLCPYHATIWKDREAVRALGRKKRGGESK